LWLLIVVKNRNM